MQKMSEMDFSPKTWLTTDSADFYLYENRIKTTIIYKGVVIILFLVIISLPFFYVDISVSATSTVRPVLEKSTIVAAVSEYVDSVYVKEGAKLHKGDIILTQRTQKNDIQHRYQSDRERELAEKISDIDKLSKGNIPSPFRSAEIQQDYLHYQSQLRKIDTDREQYEIEWKRNKILFDKGLISEREYNDVYYKYANIQNELAVLKKNQKSSWASKLYDYRMQLKEVSATDKDLAADKQLYTVKSPVDGTLEQFNGIYKGCSLTAGQEIAVVSPNGKLCLECYVSPRDIAFIKNGMEVRIQIEALNYNEWGVMTGRVTEIASDLVSANDTYYYKVKCSMDKDYLMLKHSDRRAYIKKGMSAVAHFMVTRQSLFTLIHKNVDEWANPTQYNKQQ